MSLTSWREALRRVSHRFSSCKRSCKRSVRWRVRRRMFCSRCGSELITDAKFCRVCWLTNGTNEDSPTLSPEQLNNGAEPDRSIDRRLIAMFWSVSGYTHISLPVQYLIARPVGRVFIESCCQLFQLCSESVSVHYRLRYNIFICSVIPGELESFRNY